MDSAVSSLLCLPEEMVLHLCLFLPPQDMANLAQTCRHLWSIVNKDCVWKDFVDPNVTCLESMEKQVASGSPAPSGTEPTCKNFTNFLLKQRLVNNWETGNCALVEDYIGPGLSGHIICFYREKYAFIQLSYYGIGLFDVEKTMVLHTTAYLKNRVREFNVIGDYLVAVTFCSLVHVYRINLPEKQLVHEYSFVAKEDSVKLGQYIHHVGRHDGRHENWNHWFIDEYLLMNNQSTVLHVWNISEGRKEGCFESPIHAGFSLGFHSKLGDYWILYQVLYDFFRTVETLYLFFDVKKRTFSKYICKYWAGPLIKVTFFNKFIIVFKTDEKNGYKYDTICYTYATDRPFDNDSLSVHDLNCASELRKRYFNTGKGLWSSVRAHFPTVIDGKFAVDCIDCVQLVNAITLETIGRFTFEHSLQGVAHHINVLDSLFLSVLSWEGSSYSLQLWDMTKQQVTGKFSLYLNPEKLFINRSCSKVILQISSSDVRLIHFW